MPTTGSSTAATGSRRPVASDSTARSNSARPPATIAARRRPGSRPTVRVCAMSASGTPPSAVRQRAAVPATARPLAAPNGTSLHPAPTSSGSLAGPPGYSSTITWALLPPSPNALTPALRGAPSARLGHSRPSATTWNGPWAKGASGLGRLKCRVGTWVPFRRHSSVLIRPAMPAAVPMCPMLVFTDPSPITRSVTSPYTALRAAISIGSPTGVAVPCPST